MMLVGITGMKTETLATAIFLNMTTGDFEAAAGISCMLMLISITVTALTTAIVKRSGKTVKNFLFKADGNQAAV